MEYYLLMNGTKQGPFSLEEVYTKKISPSTMVWKTGMADWVMAKDMPELTDLLSSLPPDPVKQNCGQSAGLKMPMPKTWLVESILVTVFCCLPFGIAGIVYSTQISSNYNCGNYEAAEAASRNAGKWTKIGFFVGLVLAVLYLLYFFFFTLVFI